MNTSFLKTGLVRNLTIVDSSTGEVLEETVKKYKYLAKNKEEFYIVYTSLIGVFKKLNSAEVKVYCHLLENYQVGTSIGVSATIRNIIGKDTKLSPGTVANALGQLTEKKLVYSPQRGVYKLNPRYAFQGSTVERNKMLKMILELECPDC